MKLGDHGDSNSAAFMGFVKPKNGPGSCAEQGLMGNVVLRGCHSGANVAAE